MTERRQFTLFVLGLVQNSVENQGRDVLSITGCMKDDECADHTLRLYGELPKARQAEIMQMARAAQGVA